jgi:hypothetical protein
MSIRTRCARNWSSHSNPWSAFLGAVIRLIWRLRGDCTREAGKARTTGYSCRVSEMRKNRNQKRRESEKLWLTPLIGIAIAKAFCPVSWAEDVSQEIGWRTNITMFPEAGIQMALPPAVPFKLSDTNGVLIMLHPVSGKQAAEQGYLMKIAVRRITRKESAAYSRVASNPLTDAFNRWYTTSHIELDTNKANHQWYVRKNVKTPDGVELFIDCQLEAKENDCTLLSELKWIANSITPVRAK